MPEEVKTLADEKIVVVRFYGDVTKSDFEEANRKVENLYHEENYRKVLVNAMDQENTPKIKDILSVFLNKLTNIYVAIIPPNKRKVEEDIPNILNFRPAHIFKYCSSVKEALNWLRNIY